MNVHPVIFSSPFTFGTNLYSKKNLRSCEFSLSRVSRSKTSLVLFRSPPYPLPASNQAKCRIYLVWVGTCRQSPNISSSRPATSQQISIYAGNSCSIDHVEVAALSFVASPHPPTVDWCSVFLHEMEPHLPDDSA